MKKNLFRFVLPIFMIVMMSSFAWHKFYVSVTQIDFVPNKKRVEITSRIFIDDLEKALEKRFKKKFYLTSSREIENADALIQEYLKEKIKISINKKSQNIEYLAREVEGDVLIFYTKIAVSKKINTFEIFNSLLTDIYKEQQNIVHVNVNSNKNSFLFTNSDTNQKIDY
ncbi:hypothetical protein B0I03_102120 [Flavobacterium aquaticum]|uniref:Peptidase E n=1 Tax=Flavobacterium aquaticum TaxID=1236486 RepID=A0A327YWL5_9FLAO|nr:DUF6702 family protein [Flavobacterium aquaticum]RAK24267.1 hypothetical protein B0I03_102120 [Flavobacterium aquaticum]